MKFKTKIVNLVMLMVLFFGLSIGFVYAQGGGGLGISPSRLTIDHMLRDSEYEKTFMLSHGDHAEAKYLRVLVDDSIKDWVSTDRGMEFTWPEDLSGDSAQFPVTIIVRPPSDAPNGEYSGNIRIINTASPDVSSGGTGATVSLAVAIKANFTLSDKQVLDYEVHAVKAVTEIEEDSPFEVVVHVENKGNVRARPDKVEIDFYDKFNKVKIGSQETTDFGSVAAFEDDGEIVVDVLHDLDVGQYWAHILIFKDGNIVKEEDLVFEVFPTGSLAKQGELKKLNNDSSVELGNVLKVTGDFENTGERNLTAKLVVEVYRSSNLVEVLEGDGRSVGVGQTEELTVFFTPEEEGRYVLKGKAEYSGKSTKIVESTVRVGTAGAAPMQLNLLFVGLALLVIIIAGVFFKRRNLSSGTKPEAGNSEEVEESNNEESR